MQLSNRSTRRRTLLSLSLALFALVGWAAESAANSGGLNRRARKELREAGQDRCIGKFEPAAREDVGGGWDRYTFDPEGGDGPIRIVGTPLTVFHQERSEDDLLIVLDGGGACVQGAYFCSFLANEDPPGDGGIFGESFDGIENPFADWSKIFVSYCDGSIFSGDNEVVDSNWPFGGIRYHRGVRNLTAALDLAHDLNPKAKKVLLSGISAGGYGVANYAPSLYRFIFPKSAKLYVLNDSGPSISNPLVPFDEAWQASQFFPESCTECSLTNPEGDGAYVEWTLQNDRGYKGALYSTDGDAVIRGFTFIPTQEQYRARLLDVQDPLNEEFPKRYRRFIRSGSEAHTALGFFGFYLFEADGVPLFEWVEAFVRGNHGGDDDDDDDDGDDDDGDDDDDDDDDGTAWVDIVEDFVPVP